MKKQTAEMDALIGRTATTSDINVCAPPSQSVAEPAAVAPIAPAEGYLLRGDTVTPMLDAIAEEVPVALAYNGVSHAVMMATPADLEEFALGFSLSEGILQNADELLDITLRKAPQGLIAQATISARRFAALKDRRRNLAGRTGCGLCGVDSLDQAIRPARPVAHQAVVPARAIRRALEALPGRQQLNRVIRSLHAAAFADAGGDILIAKEDVGRHNALDKLIGALATAKIDAASGFVLITSRCSYEMVQKAAAVGVPLLAAISAPTALAVRMAEAANVTMVALAREDGMRVYSHPQFIDWKPSNEETVAAE
jgi:FdhD protein